MIENLLIHRLEVYRRVEDSGGERLKDRFGQELSVNPRQHEVGGETLVHEYACRAWMPSGGLAMQERSVDVFERIFNVYTATGVDILEDDALRAVDANGHVIFGISKIKDSEVKYDSTEPHHCEFTVWEQAGPGGTT